MISLQRNNVKPIVQILTDPYGLLTGSLRAPGRGCYRLIVNGLRNIKEDLLMDKATGASPARLVQG